jgi:hypothetical protein
MTAENVETTIPLNKVKFIRYFKEMRKIFKIFDNVLIRNHKKR